MVQIIKSLVNYGTVAAIAVSTVNGMPAPSDTENPSPQPQIQMWNMASDSNFNGKRLDAIDGSVFVALKSPDPDLAAVMIFDGSTAIGPYPGQTYYIDNVAALRYTQHGEKPDGASNNTFRNNVPAGSVQGTLVQNLGPLNWTACPSPPGASPSGIAQVFVNKAGLVGEKGTGAGCTPFTIRTIPVPQT